MPFELKLDQPGAWTKLRQLDLRHSVFVMPTDTVLGISCAVSNATGIARIQNLKGREQPKFIVLVKNMAQAEKLVEVDGPTKKTIESYWPGPISFVLNSKSGNTLALRCPHAPLVHELLDCVGEPIISTSCNRKDEPVANSIAEAVELFGDQIDVYLDSEIVSNSRSPSTVVDLSGEVPKLLRQGPVPFAQLSTNG